MSDMKEKLHSGEMYLPGDEEIRLFVKVRGKKNYNAKCEL